MTQFNKSGKSSKGFGSDSSNYNTDTTHVVSNHRYDTRISPQIVSEEIITPYENDPSLVLADIEDMMRFGKIKMGKDEKLKFIAAVVKTYNLSDKCKDAINVQCVAKFGGGI